MATSFSKNLFASTYKDDYKDSDNYHRILFNAGRSLQARELTQMQTITQRELSRLLKHIFKDGSVVNPGGVLVDNEYEFVKLDTTVNAYPSGSALATLNNGTQQLTSTEGIIVQVIESTPYVSASEPATLFIKYISTQAGDAGTTPVRLTAGTTLSGGDFTFTVQSTNTPANPAVGRGTKASVHAGDFYTKERIVFSPQQSIIVSKYSNDVERILGFKVTETIETVADNPQLYDNQGATLNRSAPGADRYKIKLDLAVYEDLAVSDNFIYLCKIRDGRILDQNSAGDNYNILDKRLARRTFEESGDYIVQDFILKFDTNEIDNTKVDVDVSRGIAYLSGYRVAINKPSKITIDKPRTTSLITDEAIGTTYGVYYIARATTNNGLPNPNDQVTLNDASNFSGSALATAYVSAVEENNDGNFRIHLYNIERAQGANLSNTISIGTSITDYVNVIQENGAAKLKETNNTTYLFELPISRPQSVTGVDMTLHRHFETTIVSSQVQLSGLTGDDTFTNIGDFLFSRQSGASFTATLGTGGAGETYANFNPDENISDGVGVEVHSFVRRANSTAKQKSLTSTTGTFTPAADGTVNLARADIYRVTAVKDGTSSGIDITARYDVDNGQRDTFYDLGSLRLKPGQSSPTGNVYVEFEYFSHLTGGDFFAVNSYDGQVDYEDIPNYTRADGTVVNLRDVLDFRSVKSPSNDFTSTGGVQFRLPRNAEVIEANVRYYLGKTLRVVIDTDSNVTVLESEPSLTPQLPAKPTDTLDLFHVRMNPYMLTDKDVFTNQIKAKRYTMAAIDRLEQRVARLEEVTSLNMLEARTENLLVFDSDGNTRLKSGFFADNFYDHARSWTTNADYHASIDPQVGILRPTFVEQARRLMFDSDNSTGVVLRGDNVYLNYSHTLYQEQPFASEFININPFAVVRRQGFLELSPSTDNWVERQYLPDNVMDGGTTVDVNTNFGWNNWLWNWAGVAENLSAFGESVEGFTDTTQNTSVSGWTTTVTTQTARVTSDRVIRSVVNDRLVDTALIPFMRSRRVFFRAFGLKPNHRMFAFFDNVPVSDWVKQEDFSRHSVNDEDYGNRFNNATQHPDTPSTSLITGADGTLEGSFFIPSTPTRRFRTGTREFKLLDISIPEDRESTCTAIAAFTSSGILETRQRDVQVTREVVLAADQSVRSWTDTPPSPPPADPLAQTFFIPEPTGVYITKIGVYFATKDDTTPVICQIRPTVNGIPSANQIIAITQSIPDDSKVPDVIGNLDTASMSDIQSYEHQFEFDEPVFLAGGNEYAVVLIADTVEYNVYVSKAGNFQLNTTERRITRQPSLGSLFKSQNSSTWEPDQERDLMFKLYRADFSTTQGVARLVNARTPLELIQTNQLLTDSGDSGVYIPLLGNGFVVGDTVEVSGAQAVGGINANSINGTRTIRAVDGRGFVIDADSAATSSALGGGTSVLVERQAMMDVAVPLMDFIVPKQTTIKFTAKFLNGVSLVNNNGSVGYSQDASFTPIVPNNNNFFTSPKVIASRRTELAQNFDPNNDNKSVQMNVTMDTVDGHVSPMIDLQRCSILAIHNLIDKQAAVATLGSFNSPNTYVAETAARGGTSLAKHLTPPIALANEATGIKVFIAANRPSGADFDLYYRTDTSQDSADGILLNTEWNLQLAETNNPTDNNPNVFREYEYLIGGPNGSLTPFNAFQLKVVMKSTNSSKVPQLRDFRAIALST